MDLRGLGEARELLVGALRHDDAGIVGPEVLQPHAEAPTEQRVELHEPGPGLVEQDVVAEVADLPQDLVGRDDRAVIGALLDHRGPERPRTPPRLGVRHLRMDPDRLPQPRLVQRHVAHRPDQAVRVACGLDEDRRGARQEQRSVMRRLVVVAVEQHEVAVRRGWRSARPCSRSRCRSARNRCARRRRFSPPPARPAAPAPHGSAGRRAAARSCRGRRGRSPRRGVPRRCGRSGCGGRRRRRYGRGRSRAGCPVPSSPPGRRRRASSGSPHIAAAVATRVLGDEVGRFLTEEDEAIDIIQAPRPGSAPASAAAPAR